MTTGVREIGKHLDGTPTPYYWRKEWNGTNSSHLYPKVWIPAYHTVEYFTVYDWKGRPRDRVKLILHKGHWKRSNKKSQLAWNAYYARTDTYSQVLWGSGNGIDTLVDAPLSYFSANEVNAMYTRLQNAVRGHSFNLAVTTAQSKQVVNMAIDTVVRFTRSIRYLRKGNFPDAARVLLASPRGVHKKNRDPRTLTSKDISDAWLELQYGWQPLLNDVYNGMEAYHSIAKAPRVSRLKVRYGTTKRTVGNILTPPNYIAVTTVKRNRWQLMVELKEDLTVARSLGLTDPLSVAWELIPFSFVVDWFIPIGNYLENLHQIPKINARILSSERYQTEVYGIGKGAYAPSRIDKSATAFYRVLRSTLPVPFPEFKGAYGSPAHFWNGLALLRSAVVG